MAAHRVHMLLLLGLAAYAAAGGGAPRKGLLESSASPLECTASGYCSVGKTLEFAGADIVTGHGLKELLTHVSWRKEIMFTVMNDHPHGTYVNQILQLYQNMRALGFAHFFILARHSHSCRQVWEYEPSTPCVWDSTPYPSIAPDGALLMWYLRLRFMLRAARLGYNALSLDSDMILWRDPYPILKNPPFNDVKWMCMQEGGLTNCNGGWLYIQDAQLDGAATFMLRLAVEMPLRWMDDGEAFAKSFGRTWGTFDQALIDDAIFSTAVGRVVIPRAFSEMKGDNWVGGKVNITMADGSVKTKKMTHEAVRQNHGWALSNNLRNHQLPPPDAWHDAPPITDHDTTTAIEGMITVPNLAYGFPEEMGGQLFPSVEGEFLKAFHAQLREDCPDCPWWNTHRPVKFRTSWDTRDAASPNSYDSNGWSTNSTSLLAAAAPDGLPLDPLLQDPRPAHEFGTYWDDIAPREKYAQVPAWVCGSMVRQRQGTMLTPSYASHARMPWVFSHIHVGWPAHAKMGPRQVLGVYNWTLASKVYAAAGKSVYWSKKNVTRVLALSPHIDLARTRTAAEFVKIVTGLIQVALLTHRAPLLPDIPCSAPWLHDNRYQNINTTEMAESDELWNQTRTWCSVPVSRPIEDVAAHLPAGILYPADKEGNMLGGWVRAYGRRLLAALRAVRGRLLLGSSAIAFMDDAHAAGHHHLASMHSRQQHRHLLQQQAQGQGGPGAAKAFWQQYQQKVFLPSWFDHDCTHGLGAITTPEYHYWLHTTFGSELAPAPNATNTILLPAASAKELQLARDGKDAVASSSSTTTSADGAVSTGLLRPKPDKGWSLADVQVVLSAPEIFQAEHKLRDAPLLYLGHPVAMVKGDDRAHPSHKPFEYVMERIHAATQCRATQVKFQIYRQGEIEFVEWDAGMTRGRVDSSGRISSITTASSSRSRPPRSQEQQ